MANIFLALEEKYENLSLVMPMPFELERYLEDFNKASKGKFLALAKKSEQGFVVERVSKNGYLDVGHYVVDESDILLALWDGTFNGKVGGTGDVVNYAKRLGHKVVHILCEREG